MTRLELWLASGYLVAGVVMVSVFSKWVENDGPQKIKKQKSCFVQPPSRTSGSGGVIVAGVAE